MDSIERMEQILVMIEAHPQGIAVQDLADGCGVSWGTLKQDLMVLSSSVENVIPLFTDQDERADDDEENLFLPEVKWFMTPANRPYTPVHLNVREALGVLRTLELIQKENALKEGLKQKILSGFDLGEDKYRYIKGDFAPLEPIQGDTFPLIENAIRKELRVTAFFNGREITVDPLGIVYYSRLRYWYFVARQGETIKTYRLSNIQDLRETREPFDYPEGFSLKAWFEPRWGMEYGELIRIKVRFINRSQTIAKVRKDVAHRTSKITTQEDGSIIFQDDIIGVNEFITWVLGFGTAAEILEPPELRALILKRVRETLENYS